MSDTTHADIVGRGNREGARLFRQWFDGLVALSGAIACGRSILAAQALGADFAYIGSPWIATEEARALDDYKQAIVGNPDRKYLWLLSRTPTVPKEVRDEMLAKAQQQGYDTTKLIWRAKDSEIGK